MDEPKPLESLFKEKLFRIPDYQRGYAWGKDQLNAFWEDLVNLPNGRSHYTGVLTLKEIPSNEVKESDKEFWLIEDHSYKIYHIVDGQQRLTTFVIFLQAFVEFVRSLPENKNKPDNDIYITDTLSIVAVQKKYLFMEKPHGDYFRTYKFGYTTDNPSYEYMRYRILGEDGGGTVFETFYTLNLSNAKKFFLEQLRSWHAKGGLDGLQAVYRTLTKRFLFNEYIIKDEFDVFVAFETMNNRGKKLSDLELLKNRLIYLSTLYTDDELDPAERASLRDSINNAWKEVYYQLGRNKSKPLNDDDFLRAHWTMYFKYSRKTGRDYIRFLLDEQFTPQRVHRKVVQEVALEEADEQTWSDTDESDEDASEDVSSVEEPVPTADLSPTEIRDYVLSLKESSIHWFATFHPDQVSTLTQQEIEWIDRLNRVGMAYFRPLIMAILKKDVDSEERLNILKEIERFLFVVFKLTSSRSNYRSSEFYNTARALDKGENNLTDISEKLNERLAFAFNDDATFRSGDFYNILVKKFEHGSGYYGWAGLKYFLYEYELSLLTGSRQKKVGWNDLLKTSKDRISIEHIYPQTPTKAWALAFKGAKPREKTQYSGSLGNLILLSSSVNSALQNDSFEEKKHPKYDDSGEKVRNGFSDGSHSEIEVSKLHDWGPDQIRERGLKLIRFMEKRWKLRFENDDARVSVLFLPE